MGALFGGGAGGGYVPAPDNSALIAQQQREAEDAANKERVTRKRTGGMYSLLNPGTGYLGVAGNEQLGESA